MNVLFICKANRFRSKVAEAIFNFYLKKDKLKGIKVDSAGVKIDIVRLYVADNVKKILEEKGFELENKSSKFVNEKLIDWADRIVVVANNVSLESFPEEKTECWNIEDANEDEEAKILVIVDKIHDKVKQFVKIIKV